MQWPSRSTAIKVSGQWSPVHSLSPGASSSEWRKNVDLLAEQFCVYALDLLGFGLSDHPAIDYDGELYADLIADFLKDAVGQPAIVVGHGLSCAYAIAAAYRFPASFEQLVLVSPHEIILQDIQLGRLNAFCKLLLRAPIIGQTLCNLLMTRQNIRDYHQRQGYQNPNLVTDAFVEYLYTSAHQPKSHLALASLLSGYLHLNVHAPELVGTDENTGKRGLPDGWRPRWMDLGSCQSAHSNAEVSNGCQGLVEFPLLFP